MHGRLEYTIQPVGVRIQRSDVLESFYVAGELTLYGEQITPETLDCFNIHEEAFEDWSYIDDTSGEKLNSKQVLKARLEEMARFKKMKVYTKVKREVALNNQAGTLVGVRWVDVAKGGDSQIQISCPGVCIRSGPRRPVCLNPSIDGYKMFIVGFLFTRHGGSAR